MWTWIRATPLVLLTWLQGCAPWAAPVGSAGVERLRVDLAGGPGRSLSYLRAGDAAGPRTVFIHGTPGDATAFAHMLRRVPAGQDFVAVDRLGFGSSITGTDVRGRPRRDEVLRYAEQAEAIVPLLVDRGGRGTILVGHSLGGPIAARLAADRPDLVAGVVIIAGSLDPDLERPAWYNEVLTWWPVRALVPGEWVRANREVLAGRRENLELAPVLDNVRAPVVVIHGLRDSLVPYENVAYMQRRLRNAAVRVINLPNEDHFIPWTQADLIGQAIRDLDAQVRRR